MIRLRVVIGLLVGYEPSMIRRRPTFLYPITIDYDRIWRHFLLICPATDRRWPFTTIDGSIRSYYEVSQSYLIVTKNRRIDYWPSNCSRPSPTNYHFASVFSSATDRRWSLPFRNCPFRCLRIIDRRWSYMVVENFVVTDRITIRLRSSP